MATIMVVEDDPVISQVVCEFLKEHGHQAIPVFDGKAALEIFPTEDFALIILDIMIPSLSGIEVLKQLRKTSSVPVLMLTAMDDEYTQLISFNHMISDYVIKPFSPIILMKRIENILRDKAPSAVCSIGSVSIHADEGVVYDGEQEVKLTKKEYDILLFLMKRKGQVVSREHLTMSIWGYDDVYSRVLDNHMKNLRKKLPSLPLRTIVGRGYQIEEGNA
ncbi:response regulator transcription factor [Suipraeoptans intestinalis]|uniref:Stage 0 sporulation protein A homolog n=1 Tax=Suipraeoptans intestinalis TaxID=2606628 RepID=A0A6N7UTJ6_9FIRM|nr:response regulator transcription factor [Suipraeoptans intestinalis]MDD7770244.1 response regulator transcription factor [Suipraeoptans intestinalis]MDY3121878.1 response regulator transcription factor [Suipraeoptans intestinalis]MSR94628.1 response regulator transcription factor [Suipraeoptans intestinalis]